MKIKKQNKKDDLEKIINSFACLNIDEIDNDVAHFWQINSNHFIKNISSKEVNFIDDNGFIINCKDNSTFKVIFEPKLVTPRNITLELCNLSSQLCQSFIIDFSDSYENTVKIIQNSCYQSDNCIRRKKIETTYINKKKYYRRKLEYFVQSALANENNYSKETTEVYPYLDNCYVKSTICLGTSEGNNLGAIFEKCDGKYIKEITSSEFTSTLEKNQKNKLKILKKVA